MKKLLCAALCIVMLTSPVYAINTLTDDDIDISAPSAILMEKVTGEVIYEKNSHERLPPASVTKVMTMLLIVEAVERGDISLDDTVIASERAASFGGSCVFLEEGEKMSVHEMLKCICVVSANDCAVAMAEHPKIFPNLMVQMVAAGESSGGLDKAFSRVGSQFEKEAHLKGLIIKSAIYPVILILVIIVVVAIMMIKIVPTFTSQFDEVGGKLPGITLAVMAVSDFFVHSWYFIVAIIAGIAIFIHAWKKTEGGAHMLGKFILKVPLVGPLSIKTASSRMTRTLSTLMGSGVQLVDALGLVTEMMGNAVVKQALKDATEEVSRGIPLSKPLADSGVFPPMVYHMIEIGEETGNMEDMLDKVASYYDEEVESATEALLAAMEPLIIIVMAVIVVPIVLAIMMPMYSLYDSIGA